MGYILRLLSYVPLSSRTLYSTLLAAILASRVAKLLNGLRSVSYLPGFRIPFTPLAPPGAFLPTSWWNPGFRASWIWRKVLYKDRENFSVVPFLVGAPLVYTSNIDVMRQVLTGDRKASWDKAKGASAVLEKWGANLVACQDGEVWRRYRRVMGPAFSNTLYQMVWSTTLQLYREMEVCEGWASHDNVDIPAVQTLSTKMALLVIGKCGFGFSFDWSAPPVGFDGKMSVQEALRIIVDSYTLSMMMPNWILHLPFPGFAKIRTAVEAFTGFMAREITARTDEVRNGSETVEERMDAFTMLVRANEQETGKLRLSDQEVIGNVFILLFAGHETTAHTLSATLALLALHQDIQNEILEHILSIIGYDRDPAYDDYEKLNKVLAAFYEALRLFPAAYIMIRESTEETVLDLPNPAGDEGSTPLAVDKGTLIVLDLVGIQYNPRYHEYPEEFRPSRWYGLSSESETFPAFSLGPRACLGRKFATVEAVAFLTMLLRDWRVEPTFREGETPKAWQERVLSEPVLGITLGVRGAPVRLTRRRQAGK